MKVRVDLDPESTENNCYNNCVSKVARSGGEVVVGWRVTSAASVEGYMLVRDNHAIWKSPSGELIDISPRVVLTSKGITRVEGEEAIEFEVDETATFIEGKSRSSVFVPGCPDPHGLIKKASQWATKASSSRNMGDVSGADYADAKAFTFLQQHHRRVTR